MLLALSPDTPEPRQGHFIKLADMINGTAVAAALPAMFAGEREGVVKCPSTLATHNLCRLVTRNGRLFRNANTASEVFSNSRSVFVTRPVFVKAGKPNVKGHGSGHKG